MSFKDLQSSRCSLMDCNLILAATRSFFNPIPCSPNGRNSQIRLLKDLTHSGLIKPQQVREAVLKNREYFNSLPPTNFNDRINTKSFCNFLSAGFSFTVRAFFKWGSHENGQACSSTISKELQDDLIIAKQELEYWIQGHSKLMAFLQSDPSLWTLYNKMLNVYNLGNEAHVEEQVEPIQHADLRDWHAYQQAILDKKHEVETIFALYQFHSGFNALFQEIFSKQFGQNSQFLLKE